MNIPTCNLATEIVTITYCTCAKCGRKVQIPNGKDCATVHTWCKDSPEYKEYFEKLRSMTKEEREAYLAEQRAANATIEPGMLAKAWNYSEAVTRWKLAGSPTRSQAEIDAILTICKACPFYTETDRPRCRKCGCSVNNQPNGITNKIAMATESCPLDPPKWEATA